MHRRPLTRTCIRSALKLQTARDTGMDLAWRALLILLGIQRYPFAVDNFLRCSLQCLQSHSLRSVLSAVAKSSVYLQHVQYLAVITMW